MDINGKIWEKEVESKCNYFLELLGMLRIILPRTLLIWELAHAFPKDTSSIVSQQGREKTHFNLILERKFEWLDMNKESTIFTLYFL